MATAWTSGDQTRKLLIPGGGGFLGQALADWFTSRGWEVAILSRSSATRGSLRVVEWDGRTVGLWASLLDGCDAVINLAGRTVNCRYDEKHRREIYDSRLDSTRVIGEAIAKALRPPPVWLNASTATIYRHATDHPQDEITGEITADALPVHDSTLSPSTLAPGWNEKWAFSVDVAKRWEEVFFSTQTPSTRKIALRIAIVLGRAPGTAFEVLDRLVRFGLGGTIAPGNQMMSWIHAHDFCNAVQFLIDRADIEGPVNLASPNALPNHQFMRDFRAARGRHIGLPTARWMMEAGAFFLRTESELMLKSRWAYPRRLLDAGFQFKFPTWPAAVRDLVRS